MVRPALAALWLTLLWVGCTEGRDPVRADCIDELDNPVPCEILEDSPELPDEPDVPQSLAEIGGVDGPQDYLPGPDDLDGMADESLEVLFAQLGPDAELASGGVTDVGWGRTRNAERRELLPIGRTSGATRYVVMRLRPEDIPNLRLGDTLRAASEIQVTTRCDIGQVAPGCDYSPNVRMQLLLTGSPNATDPRGPGTMALSDVKGFDCTKDDHHCVKTINFTEASRTLYGTSAPPCVADNSCFINFVMWAYDSQARSGGVDKLIIGANEGDFLANGKVEQDRGRVMVVREREVTAADKFLRVTSANVRNGRIGMFSNGDSKRIYSHTLKGGNDLKAGEKFRLWAEVDASSDHRVNLQLQMFLTKNRYDKNGGAVADIQPLKISEHNGTNCSPGNPCHLKKVAVFAVDRDISGPVYVNIIAACQVPGPGSANVTIENSGYVKSIRYAQ